MSSFKHPQDYAAENLNKLMLNPYPGRGIVLGQDQNGNLIQVYWIMGRSDNSRNRVFVVDGKKVSTAAADPTKVQDPSLIIYTAMNERGGLYVVSNGHHTDALMEYSNDYGLKEFKYEPDKPNYTPRIAGQFESTEDGLQMCINMIAPVEGSAIGDDELPCVRKKWTYEEFGKPRALGRNGLGYCVTTYSGDGDPLPGFKGDPYLVPLVGPGQIILDTYWRILNEENLISLAVKVIDPQTGESEVFIKNKYTQVQPEV